MADDSTLAWMLGITGQDQSTQPTAAATGTPIDPNDPTGQGDFPGKPPWAVGRRGVLPSSSGFGFQPNVEMSPSGPVRSTADLANWRNYYGTPKLFYDLPWNTMRQNSVNAMNTINKMPWVFSPQSQFWGATTGDIRNSIFPGIGLGENSLLATQGTGSGGLQSLLDSLTSDQRTMLQQLLGVGGGTTTANPSTAAGATSTPAATSPVTQADPTQAATPLARGLPSATSAPSAPAPLPPWQQALSSNNDAFFGLPENTLSVWKQSGLPRNLGVDPSDYWFFQGLSPDAQAAFMQHQSQYRGGDSPGSLQSILSAWNQPAASTSNPLGIPYPWSQ